MNVPSTTKSSNFFGAGRNIWLQLALLAPRTQAAKPFWKWFLLCAASSSLSGCQRAAPPTRPALETQSAGVQEAAEHANDEKKLATLFPGALLKEKPLVLGKQTGALLRGATGLQLSGGESEWEAFEATKNGRGQGWALLSHAELPIGEMHLGLTTTRDFKITNVVAMERTNDEFSHFVAQFKGKNARQPFRAGRDLKLIAGYPPQFSQAVADTAHRGLWLLENSFGPPTSKGKGVR